jgi:hypothetical protein
MKIKRDAFLYFDGGDKHFAQCGTCIFGKSKCALAGGIDVNPTIGSCGLYVKGPPLPRSKPFAKLDPKDMGYVERQVRCENCYYFDYKEHDCELFELLNLHHPGIFDLEEDVKSYGCCNAQVPK